MSRSARTPHPAASRGARRGYTVVELMMGLALLAVGVTGILAMQRVVIEANTSARDVSIANRIAATWLDQLHLDAAMWNHPSEGIANSDIGDTTWLKAASDPPVWMLPNPTFDSKRAWGAAFDALGNPVIDPAAPNVRFCAHLFLAYLSAPGSAYGRIRATVRVVWQRPGGDNTLPFCEQSAVNDLSKKEALDDFAAVYHTTVIAEQTAQRQ